MFQPPLYLSGSGSLTSGGLMVLLSNKTHRKIMNIKTLKTAVVCTVIGAFSAASLFAGAMKEDMMMHDGVMMKDGKMMVMKEGKTMKMEKDMTMSDGTMVMTDGQVKMKDGKTMKMKDGQMVMMDGKVMMMKDGKMMGMEH